MNKASEECVAYTPCVRSPRRVCALGFFVLLLLNSIMSKKMHSFLHGAFIC